MNRPDSYEVKAKNRILIDEIVVEIGLIEVCYLVIFRRRQTPYLPTGLNVFLPHLIRVFDVEFRV